MKSLKFERIVTLDAFVHERRNNIDAKTCLFLFFYTYLWLLTITIIYSFSHLKIYYVHSEMAYYQSVIIKRTRECK